MPVWLPLYAPGRRAGSPPALQQVHAAFYAVGNSVSDCNSLLLCRRVHSRGSCQTWSLTVQVWKQLAPDTDQAPLLGCCSGVVFTVLFHPKDLMLFSGGEDADVRVWDLNTKSCVAALKVSPGLPAVLQAQSLASSRQADCL